MFGELFNCSLSATFIVHTRLMARVTHVDQINALSALDRNRGVKLALQSVADTPCCSITCNRIPAWCCTPAIYQLFIAASTFAKYYSVRSRDSQILLLHVYTVLRVDARREKNIPPLARRIDF